MGGSGKGDNKIKLKAGGGGVKKCVVKEERSKLKLHRKPV